LNLNKNFADCQPVKQAVNIADTIITITVTSISISIAPVIPEWIIPSTPLGTFGWRA
jgi:hypothetical protein